MVKSKIANLLFNNGRYAEALRLYQTLERQFGPNFARINIKLCREYLAQLDSSSQAESSNLDPITRLLLDNANRLLPQDQRTALERLIQYGLKNETEVPSFEFVNPRVLPDGLELSPLPKSTNDYIWARQRRVNTEPSPQNLGLSIVIPTYNRARILSITLASIVNQETDFPYEVIVADDGSQENIEAVVESFKDKLDITWVWQEDLGFRVSAARNLGLSVAKYPYIAILDCDMAPCPQWVTTYMQRLMHDDGCAYIGPRRYKDTTALTVEHVLKNTSAVAELPDVLTNNTVAGKVQGDVSVDWRLEHVKATESLRLCNHPFNYFAGGNIAFAKKWVERIGGFDESFNHWGGEDVEFGYRLYRAGCFFEFEMSAMAFHQEPPGKENETDREAGHKITREHLLSKAPYYYRREIEPLGGAVFEQVPLVSIYIPAYNCQDTLRLAIESALSQTIVDLEVVVCNDGSSDGTQQLLETFYDGHPRVRFIRQDNSGIGAASNAAVRMCRGFYIGQLDADDFLEPNAVELCLNAFWSNPNLVCVYSAYRNVLETGDCKPGFNWPVFSREKLMETMICHHFRMFTIRAWNLTSGFNEAMKNAVDYDMFLKLSEVGDIYHVNAITYNRYLHNQNTSIINRSEQIINHLKAINSSLTRQNIENFRCQSASLEEASFKPVIINI